MSSPVYLCVRFDKLLGQPDWAAVDRGRKRKRRRHTDSTDESGSDEEENSQLLQRTGNLLCKNVDRLPKDVLAISRLKDANHSKRAQGVVRAVEFHPTASVLLTAGFHKTLDLFQVLPTLHICTLLSIHYCTVHILHLSYH